MPRGRRLPAKKKPSVATSHGGSPSCSAARAMAGCSRDQKLAAIMTPAEKPSMRFIASGDGLRNRNTVAAFKGRHGPRPKRRNQCPNDRIFPYSTSRFIVCSEGGIACMRKGQTEPLRFPSAARCRKAHWAFRQRARSPLRARIVRREQAIRTLADWAVFSPTYMPPEKMISLPSPPAGGELCEA